MFDIFKQRKQMQEPTETKINSIDLDWLSSGIDKNQWKTLNEQMTFVQYVSQVSENPKLVRSAYQRLYDMIMEKGVVTKKRFRKTIIHYNFFDDSEIPVIGNAETKAKLVKFIRGAAGWYGTEKRVLLLHGPVGSAKSTLCALLKRGLERYSRTPNGAWYTYQWVNLKPELFAKTSDMCPMHDDPLKLIPKEVRQQFLSKINEIHYNQAEEKDKVSLYELKCDGELNPRCALFMKELMSEYEGDWKTIMEKHIVVHRMVYSEADRCGIATFQPKDEKNQDATELTGDINYSTLSHYGSDSDARAFNFDGEFCVGNRGMVEFIEMLKLAQEFLYDLLGASQERQIKPKKFAQVGLDTVLLGHTNNPEYEKLKNNQSMEALRDRTEKIDVPYLLSWSDEIKVLEKDYNPSKIRQHIAPHTIEIAALWDILTRLEDDKEGKLTLVEKVKLYDGRALPGSTEDTVKELMDRHPDEGMKHGVSARYTQNKISNCLASHYEYINPFMVLNELQDGLTNSSLITNKDETSRYLHCIDLAKKELDQILKSEVQKALVGDEEAIVRLCSNYIDNLVAFIKKSKVINPYTLKEQQPDERLMRSIEEKIDIPETGSEDYRRSVAEFMGMLSNEGKKFTWDSNPKLRKAFEMKLFEDTKDHIKLSALNNSGASVVDPDLQDKIDAIKLRLIKNNNYNQQSASDVLSYIGSIFAHGDVAEDD
jgi:serine protein kinase